jgi:hypothetical protein
MMSEQMLTVFLNELGLVRVTCAHKLDGAPCPGVIEVPLEQLFRVKTCPVCANDFNSQEFSEFANAVKALLACTGLRVGFVVHPPEPK